MIQPIQELVERYRNNLYAVAFNVCKNAEDAEDVVQDTFLQFHTAKKEFESEQHIRAWLIRVTINKAKNMNHTFWRQNKLSFGIFSITNLRKLFFGGRKNGYTK